MISNLWLFMILVYACNGQPGYSGYESFSPPDRRPDYRSRGEYRRGTPISSLDYYDTGPTLYDSGYDTYSRPYSYRESPPIQYHPDYSQSYRESLPTHYLPEHRQIYEERRPPVDYDNVFAGRYEQFGSSPPRRTASRVKTRSRPTATRSRPPTRGRSPTRSRPATRSRPPTQSRPPSRSRPPTHSRPPSRSQPPTRSRPATRRQTTRRQGRPSGPRRQRHEEVVREGYVGAKGGENFFPFMGGYCAGQDCADGGEAAGVGSGIGTGSLTEFLRRRQSGQNEDIRVYEAYVAGQRT